MIKKMISYVYRLFFNFLSSHLSIKKNTILFESFNGKLPSDNPYYIYLDLVEKHPDWRIYWGIKKNFKLDAEKNFPEINFISRFSIRWLLVATQTNFWIFNSRMPHWLKKNKETIYIQTWHGTPLKKLGLDIDTILMPGTDTETYKKNFIYESDRWNYLIAPNQYSKRIFQRAFHFKNSFLDIGYPRNDILVNAKNDVEYIEKIKKKIVGDSQGKIILYAPTWRDDYYVSKGNYKFFMPFDLEKVIEALDEEDILILRPHYLVGESIDIQKYEKNVRISLDDNINDLYLISDVLITDYSSVMFDFAILRKPIIFYAYDLMHYKEQLRGFYFDYFKELPGPICKTSNEFYEALNDIKNIGEFNKRYETKYASFYNRFCQWEKGNASTQVTDLVERIGRS